MKKSIFLTTGSFILYFLRSLICGILTGTFKTNESIAEICSIFIVLAIVFFMIRKKEELLFYGICMWKAENFYKKISFFFLFRWSIFHIYFQVQK